MKRNYQRGTIYEASNSYFVRYFDTVEPCLSPTEIVTLLLVLALATA